MYLTFITAYPNVFYWANLLPLQIPFSKVFKMGKQYGRRHCGKMVGYSDNIFRPEGLKGKESWFVIVANRQIKAVKLNNLLALVTRLLICEHRSNLSFYFF